MNASQLNSDLNQLKRIAMFALGWAIFRSYIQFTVLVTEGSGITSISFAVELIIAILASAQLSKLEQSLKTWLISIVFSIMITLMLMLSPVLFGVLNPQLISFIFAGSIQPIATILLLSAPLDLLGSFLGQVLRNKLL